MAKEQDLKRHILNVAKTLFHKQGYFNTGVNQIIAEAGIAKASLYYHYPTKEALCVAYLEDRRVDWKEGLQYFLNKTGHPVEAVYDFLKKDNTENQFRGCSFLNMVSEYPEANSEILRVIRDQKTDLLHFFEVALSDQKQDLAYILYSLFENAIIESQLYKSQEPVERLKQISLSLYTAAASKFS